MLSLKVGIEDLKQAKTLMSEANHIMSDHVSKLKALEEENEQLRSELGAMQIQSDASYMKLPLDADGVPIRVGDEMDIDGEIAVVKGYQVSYKGDELQFIAVTEGYRKTFTLFGKNRKHFKHDTMPSDSWEKLEEDAKKSPCRLVGSHDGNCTICRWLKSELTCDELARLEILKRAKKLAGIEEEAER